MPLYPLALASPMRHGVKPRARMAWANALREPTGSFAHSAKVSHDKNRLAVVSVASSGAGRTHSASQEPNVSSSAR